MAGRVDVHVGANGRAAARAAGVLRDVPVSCGDLARLPGADRRLVGDMLADDLFHPHHIVPAAELAAAVAEQANLGKPHPLVEAHAVEREVLVGARGVGDAGVQVRDAHVRELGFQGVVGHAPGTLPASVTIQVNGGLA